MPSDLATPVDPASRRRPLREGLVALGLAAVLLLLLTGPDIRESGERMDPGPVRALVLAVGVPAGWVAERLPFAALNDRLVSWLSPDEELAGTGAPAEGAPGGAGAGIGPEAFDPRELGAPARAPRPLRTVLVTGDSMAMPLDVEVARRTADSGAARTLREPHVGTGLSKSALLDWTELAPRQARKRRPEAVVVFIGANEGFPFGDVECCSPEWAAQYAARVRTMMGAYRQAGGARVYWLTLPMPRDRDRQAIARTVNAAIRVAAQPWRADVRVLDMAAVFTPGGTYRASMPVDGRQQLVRDPDGIHLNAAGARIAADAVLAAIERDFGAPAPR